jgi:hypothetical protein
MKIKLLFQIKRIWILFGLLFKRIISPIFMAIIFFGLITPYGIAMRLIGRDQLSLKRVTKKSHWIIRNQKSPQTDFTKQY